VGFVCCWFWVGFWFVVSPNSVIWGFALPLWNKNSSSVPIWTFEGRTSENWCLPTCNWVAPSGVWERTWAVKVCPGLSPND